MSKGLYEFFEDCGKMGEISGLFIADSEDVVKAFGRTIYMGDVLGKHSEIDIDLSAENVKLLSNDIDKIEWLQNEVFSGETTLSGYNPLDYLDDYEEED